MLESLLRAYRPLAQCCRKALHALVCALTWLSVAGPVLAGPPIEKSELEMLYERLDAQEARIRELEMRRLPAVTFTQSQADPGEPSPALEVLPRVLSLEEALGELDEPSLVRVRTESASMALFGRIHVDAWQFPGDSPGVNALETRDPGVSPQDRFNFRRVRVGVRGRIRDNMLYRIQLEFAGGVSEFRDVYLGFSDLAHLQTVLFGNQKRPYGLDHLNSSRYNVFIERPFVIEAVNQDSRRLGAVAYGVSDDQAYNWRYGVYNMRLIQDEGAFVSDHWQLEGAGRFANTIWYDEASDGRGYAHWALAGSVAHPDGFADGDPDPIGSGRAANEARFRTRPEARSSGRWIDTGRIDGADWYELLAAETVINIGPLQWVAEFQNVWLQRDAGFGPDLRFHGGYMYLAYFLTGEHVPWDRDSGVLGRVRPFENFWLVDTCDDGVRAGWGAWQIAVRWSYADFSDRDILGGVGESVTFGLNWHWNPNARMQFNYVYGDISDHEPVAGLTSGDYHILGTRLMVDF